MSLEIPSPDSVDRRQRQRLRALLDAQLHLPKLVERLSVGFMTIDTETASRWAGWVDSLHRDPAWEVIQPVLEMPEAWPEAWDRARKAGFSAETEHHQAIFFTRLFERAVDESRFELAELTWKRALASWSALSGGTYLREQVLADGPDDLTDEQFEQVVSRLLDGPLDELRQLANRALRSASWDAPPGRRPLRFVLQALEATRQTFADESGPLAEGVVGRIGDLRRHLHQTVVDELDHRLENLEPADVELRPILQLFDGALSRSRHLDHPPRLERAILRRGLDLIWDLRDAGRDDELGVVPPMVDRLEPCARRLREAPDDEFFGLEGAVADLLVFKGEESMSIDDRQEAFEEALEICPGHRNASRLLSYLLLERANRDLLKTAALPDATARIGAVRRRIRPLVERAAGHIDRAETLYPENDLLDQYRSDLEGEIERFKLAPESTDEDR